MVGTATPGACPWAGALRSRSTSVDDVTTTAGAGRLGTASGGTTTTGWVDWGSDTGTSSGTGPGPTESEGSTGATSSATLARTVKGLGTFGSTAGTTVPVTGTEGTAWSTGAWSTGA